MTCHKRISVIIPVYNVENYLEDCINSVLCQTCQPWEILLVDDGSTDRSGEICDRYAEKNRRIQVIHGSNKGLSAARNVGIERFSGDYVAFVDSDDQIHPDYLRTLLELSEIYGAELVSCKFIRGKKCFWNEEKGDDRIEIRHGREILEKMNTDDVTVTVVWNKLYSRKLFEKEMLRFPEGKLYEDMYFTPQILRLCDTMVLSEKELYFYRQRPRSIMSDSFNLKKLDALDAIEFRIHFFNKWKYDDLKYVEYEGYIRKICFLYEAMKTNGSDLYGEYMEELGKKAVKLLRNKDVMLHISWKYRVKLLIFLFVFRLER